MSVVVGVEYRGKVWMAADSLVSDADDIIFETSEPPKVYKWRDFVLGIVGSFRVGNVVPEFFEPPKQSAAEKPLSYMLQKFVPELRRILEENYVSTDYKVVGDEFQKSEDWTIMAGFGGRIYIVDEDFSVSRAADGYAFIGSGGEIAGGALFVTKDSKKPRRRVEQAVQAAIKHCSSVGGKIVVESI